MDKDKGFICRWDSTPHNKEVRTFPYHLHTKKGMEDSKKINLIEIFDDISGKVLENPKL